MSEVMDYRTILGVGADADERTIKRRYALLLKENRPEDDPEGFQRLRDAYERALFEARAAADAADESRAPVAQLESKGAAHSPTGSSEMQVYFQDPSEESLNLALIEVEAQGRRAEFEKALLEQCLQNHPGSVMMARWALSQLEWFSINQRVELPVEQLNALSNGLLHWALANLDYLLENGREHDFLGWVEGLLQEAWLQAYERRATFHHSLVRLLLDANAWSASLFHRVSDICGWTEAAPHVPEWGALAHRAEAVAFGEQLQAYLQEDSAPAERVRDDWGVLRKAEWSSERKAAWLLLKPMDETQRYRFSARFTAEDWHACARLADLLQHRFRPLLAWFDHPDLDSWESLVPRPTGWARLNWVIWLFLLSALWLGDVWLGDVWKAGKPAGEPGLLVSAFLSMAFVTAVSTWFLRLFGLGWSALLDRLSLLEVKLDQWILPDGWRVGRRGLSILRHVLPCLVLATLFYFASGLRGEKGYAAGFLAFLLCSGYAWFAAWGVSPLEMLSKSYHRWFPRRRDRVLLSVALTGLIVLWIYIRRSSGAA